MKSKWFRPPTTVQRWNAWYRERVTPVKSMSNWTTAAPVSMSLLAALAAFASQYSLPLAPSLFFPGSERLFRTQYMPITPALPFGLISEMCL